MLLLLDKPVLEKYKNLQKCTATTDIKIKRLKMRGICTILLNKANNQISSAEFKNEYVSPSFQKLSLKIVKETAK